MKKNNKGTCVTWEQLGYVVFVVACLSLFIFVIYNIGYNEGHMEGYKTGYCLNNPCGTDARLLEYKKGYL